MLVVDGAVLVTGEGIAFGVLRAGSPVVKGTLNLNQDR